MGSRIDYTVLLDLVTQEYERAGTVSGPERRVGAQISLPQAVEEIAQSLTDIRRIVGRNVDEFQWGATQLTEVALEMTSVLFSSGATPVEWRRWAGLTSLGYCLTAQRLYCAQFAALAGEWELLARLDRSPINSWDVGSVVFWSLIGGEAPQEPEYRDDPFDMAWQILRQSVSRREHEKTAVALKEVAEYWIGDSEGRWEMYHPGEPPNFEQVINAVAALARHQGFVPINLSPAQLRFLDAGLALGGPAPLVSGTVTIAERP